ncbi:MAG: hypothetical protein U1F39_13055 [Steroidobacteraceae bacterium]
MPDLALTLLDDLAVLGAHGPDVLPFLNGQLSQDLTLLPERGSQLAGLHNPQGRVIALVRTLYLDDAHVLLVLPRELADAVRTHLQRFVFRARVRIEDASAAWCAYGLAGPDAETACSTRLHISLDASGMRQLVVAPRGEPMPQSRGAPRDEMARRGHRRRHPRGHPCDLGTVGGADAEPGPAWWHLVREGLLHRAGSHCPRAFPRPGEAPDAALLHPLRDSVAAGRESAAAGWPRGAGGDVG